LFISLLSVKGLEAPRDVRERISEALKSQPAALELNDIGLEGFPKEFFQYTYT
jgi:hypothetical protein